MITTEDFGFTNAEVGFIKKHFQRKYPAVMGDFIDRTRDLMKSLQTKSKLKLTYNAWRYYPEDSPRYHISESLGMVSETNLSVFVSVRPVEPAKKALFGANKGDETDQEVTRLIQDLHDLTQVRSENYLKAETCSGIPMPFVIETILGFIIASKDELIVQSRDIYLAEQSHISFDLSHKASRSHYLCLRIDFTNQPTVSVES